MKSCKERIREELKGRIDDLQKLFRAYQEGEEEKYSDELGTFLEYGLCFDYVPPYTFQDRDEGYFRYQLSWGGPSDEFRFYPFSLEDTHPRIEYWFLDWFDGAKVTLQGKAYNLLRDIWEFFQEIGSVQAEYEKACDF